MGILSSSWAWHPPVGVWIGVLGLIGVIVPLMREPSKMAAREKAVWTFVMFVLLLLEFKSVYQDRNEHDAAQAQARAEQLAKFAEIAGQINVDISNSQSQFDETVRRQSEDFTATMEKAQENLNQMTGGNTYPLISFLPVPLDDKLKFRLYVQAMGSTPLFDVSIEVNRLPFPKTINVTELIANDAPEFRVSSFSATSLSPNRIVYLPPITLNPDGTGDFLINMMARNGIFHESLHVRKFAEAPAQKGNGLVPQWEWSGKVTREVTAKKRHYQVTVRTLPWARTTLWNAHLTSGAN